MLPPRAYPFHSGLSVLSPPGPTVSEGDFPDLTCPMIFFHRNLLFHCCLSLLGNDLEILCAFPNRNPPPYSMSGTKANIS